MLWPTLTVKLLPMASTALPPMACVMNFSETQARFRPASVVSFTQRPYRICESSSSACRAARFLPVSCAVMVVVASPYLAMVALPTCCSYSI